MTLQNIIIQIQIKYKTFILFYSNYIYAYLPDRFEASMPERSKGVDLRPTVSPKRVGSNPTGCNVLF